MIFLNEIKKHESKQVVIKQMALHTADADETVRSLCLATLQEYGLNEMDTALRREGMRETLGRIAAAPLNATFLSFIIHLVRFEIERKAEEKDMQITGIGTDSLIHLLSDGNHLDPLMSQ